jgi:metal-responsive CopG/Arc/MetJ family transcriptional regulator
MARILTDIPDEDIEKLDALSTKAKRSRAATIREAVKLYLVQNSDNNDWIERGYGYWAGRTDIGDGVEYQRAMREDRTPYEDL